MQTEKIKGVIERYFFKNDTFGIGVVRKEGGGEVKFKGDMVVGEGETVEMEGSWLDDPKYGPTYKVKSFSIATPTDPGALARYIAKSEAFPGIGPKNARKLVDACGGNVDEAIEDPEGFAVKSGVKLDLVRMFCESWLSKIDLNRTIAALTEYDVGAGRAASLFEEFGANILEIVRTDPYWLIGKVPGMAFLSVDKIALAAGIDKRHPHRIHHAVMAAMKLESNDGHTWAPKADVLKRALALLSLDGLDDEGLVEDAIDTDCGAELGSLIAIPSSVPGQPIALRYVWSAETYISQEITRRGRSISNAGMSVGDAKSLEPMLNDDQAAACVNAWNHGLSIVTGGAGVGKTFTIDAIVRGFETAMDATVLCCAPTGKAAKRMEQSMRRGASTIHRALEPQVSEGEGGEVSFFFGRDQSNPIEADVVIVDEFSMVDVLLMQDLLRAVDPSRTSIVLVGDYNQLPPVGPGAILRDAVDLEICPTVRLNKVMRQAGMLKENVSALLEGKAAPTCKTEKDATEVAPWYLMDKLSTPGALVSTLTYTFERMSKMTVADLNGDQRPIDPVWDLQILTPMHKGPIGTRALNLHMQRLAQARHGVEVPVPENEKRKPDLLRHDKVLFNRNNPKLGLSNGSMGKILQVLGKHEYFPDNVTGCVDEDGNLRKGPGFVIDFDTDGIVAVAGENRNNLQLAYAMTVHKAQGSEVPVAICVVHKSHSIMHHRGLFYTAASRSSRCCFVLGDRWGIDNCLQTVKTNDRRTLFALAQGNEKVRGFAELDRSA